MSERIVVVGSLNMDIIVSAARFPDVGETISGQNVKYLPGGKGANQAVGARKLGVPTDLIGVVGNDLFGDKIINKLSDYQVNTEYIFKNEDTATGIANIIHLPTDNSIIIVPGANMHCTSLMIAELEQAIATADVLLLQLEIPVSTVQFALTIAKRNNVKTILNPAPAVQLPEELLHNAEYVTPNKGELEILLETKLDLENNLEEAFASWSARYSNHLIVTLGEKGCAYMNDGSVEIVPAKNFGPVVDTTGAGDSFNAEIGRAHV